VTWKNAAFYDRAGQRPGHGNNLSLVHQRGLGGSWWLRESVAWTQGSLMYEAKKLADFAHLHEMSEKRLDIRQLTLAWKKTNKYTCSFT